MGRNEGKRDKESAQRKFSKRGNRPAKQGHKYAEGEYNPNHKRTFQSKVGMQVSKRLWKWICHTIRVENQAITRVDGRRRRWVAVLKFKTPQDLKPILGKPLTVAGYRFLFVPNHYDRGNNRQVTIKLNEAGLRYHLLKDMKSHGVKKVEMIGLHDIILNFHNPLDAKRFKMQETITIFGQPYDKWEMEVNAKQRKLQEKQAANGEGEKKDEKEEDKEESEDESEEAGSGDGDDDDESKEEEDEESEDESASEESEDASEEDTNKMED